MRFSFSLLTWTPRLAAGTRRGTAEAAGASVAGADGRVTSAGARAAAKRDDAISTLKEKQQPFFLWIISVRVGETASFFPPSPYHIRAFLKIKKEKSEQFLQVVSVDDFSLSLSLSTSRFARARGYPLSL